MCENNVQFNKNISVRYQSDVLVVGGGPAGIASALAARSQGFSVRLIEAHTCLGGMGTAGMVPAFSLFKDDVNFMADGVGRIIYNALHNAGAIYDKKNIHILTEEELSSYQNKEKIEKLQKEIEELEKQTSSQEVEQEQSKNIVFNDLTAAKEIVKNSIYKYASTIVGLKYSDLLGDIYGTQYKDKTIKDIDEAVYLIENKILDGIYDGSDNYYENFKYWLTDENISVMKSNGDADAAINLMKNIVKDILETIENNIQSKQTVNSYEGNIKPEKDTIFVFGSNPEGRHGAGAAKIAKEQFGAKYGQGEGLQGNAYALPTKDLRVKENKGLKSIKPEQIIESIKKLYATAKQHPNKKFKIAYRNTDKATLNGYTGYEMIEMFKQAGEIPSNIYFSKEWVDTGMFNTQSKIGFKVTPLPHVPQAEKVNLDNNDNNSNFEPFGINIKCE